MSGKSDSDGGLEGWARLLGRLPIAGWVKRDGRYVYVNPEWAEQLGQQAEEVVGRTDAELWPAGVAASLARSDQQALARGRGVQEAERLPHRDGSWHESLAVRFTCPDPQGTLLCGLQVDRSEGRSTLPARASQAMLEAIHRAQIQFIRDSDPRPSFDRLLEALLAVTESEYGFVGEVCLDPQERPFLRTLAITDVSWNEETRALYRENVGRGLEFRNLATLFGRVMTSHAPVLTNDPVSHPAQGGLPPGHPRLDAFLGLPLMYGEELVGMVGIANRTGGYDEALTRALEPLLITSATMVNAHRIERRRQEAEEVLEAREEQLRTLVEQASDGIFVTDRSGAILDVNGVGARMLGRTREEVIGLPLSRMIEPTEHERLGQELVRLELGETVVGEWCFLRGDQSTFTGEVSAKRLSDGRLQRIVRDISERKRAESARAELEAQLRQSQKMEAVGTLAGGIAHDFNNILSAIVANTEMIELDPSSPSARAGAQEVLAACRRARDLIERILAFGRRQDTAMRPLDLGPVVDEALQLLRSTIPAGVELRRLGAASLPPVLADGSQVHQVVMNLVNNAWYAVGRSGGWIAVGLEPRTLAEDEPLPHPDLRPGDWVVLEVLDNGRGMLPSTIERIFEPFFTTKEVGEGTGLGLSVVHGILRGHQGAITAESTWGEGSVFRAWFPVTLRALEPTPAAPEPGDWRGSGRRVLFVDDELALVNVACRWFGRFGYQVTACLRADEALELFRKEPSRYEVVITDLSMPGMSGLDLARELRALRSELRIVLTSGHLSAEQHAIARSLEVRVLPKPYLLDDLGRCLG